MALNSSEKTPISQHRLFPGLVALWFAAMLGIGSLAIRSTVLENVVLALGIDRIVPASAPPLGFTARLLLAAMLAVLGAVAGYVLARRLAAQPAPVDDLVPAEAAPVAAPDTGDEADDNDDFARLEAARAATPPGRRRALTTESSLGEQRPAILHLGELDHLEPEPDSKPDAPTATEVAPEPAPEPAPAPVASAPLPEPVAAPASAALAGLAIPELVERFARALAARGPRHTPRPGAAILPEPEPQPDPEPEAPSAIAAQPAFVPEFEAESEPEPAPVAELPVEAVAEAEASPPAEPAPFAAAEFSAPARPFDMPASLRQPGLGNIEWFDDEVEEAAAEATLESLLPPKRRASWDPLRSLAEQAEPDPEFEEEAAIWALPDPEGEPIDEDTLEDDPTEGQPFSSLLSMKPSTRTPPPLGSFVRVEDEGEEPAEGAMPEPIVTFPGQAVPAPPIPARLPGAPFGATPVETEAALRDALAALQKMSGAA